MSAPTRTLELAPLRIGHHEIWPPVVLAPMAGVTNAPFRELCRSQGAGLYVSEMIAARGLVEGHDKTHRLARFGPGETPRSIQLYGTDPTVMGEAVRRLVGELGAEHVDLNFGCPVRKVTRHGGGSALPWRRRLFQAVVAAAVHGAGDVPVTVKLRMGIDDHHLTYLDAGPIAAGEGAAAVALHARGWATANVEYRRVGAGGGWPATLDDVLAVSPDGVFVSNAPGDPATQAATLTDANLAAYGRALAKQAEIIRRPGRGTHYGVAISPNDSDGESGEEALAFRFPIPIPHPASP